MQCAETVGRPTASPNLSQDPSENATEHQEEP